MTCLRAYFSGEESRQRRKIQKKSDMTAAKMSELLENTIKNGNKTTPLTYNGVFWYTRDGLPKNKYMLSFFRVVLNISRLCG